MKKPTYWSASGLGLYEKCPAAYEWNKVLRIKDDLSNNTAVQRGVAIHKMAEGVLNGTVTGIPTQLNKFAVELTNLKKAEPVPEADISFTANFQPCAYNDWGKVWCISKADAFVNLGVCADIIDFKTGSARNAEKYRDQMEVYALAAFVHAGSACKIVTTELWFVDDGSTVCQHYKRRQLKALQTKYHQRAGSMLEALGYPRTPSRDACRWCSRRNDKGGDCEAWKNT